MQSLEAANNGDLISLAAGQSFVLELQEAPTTGFRWRVIEQAKMLRLIADTFTAPPGAQVGGSGRRRWVFSADHEGTGALRLELAAQTPRDTPPQSFAVELNVGPALVCGGAGH